jgi:hypothetical protein
MEEPPKLREIVKKFVHFKENPSVDFKIEDTDIVIDPTDTISVLGQKSSGKSYWLSALADMLPKSIIYDPHWERTTGKNKASMSQKAHKMGDKWFIVDRPAELEKAIIQKKTHIIIHPPPLTRERTKESLIAEFDDYCEIVWHYGNFTFFVDELDMVNDNYHVTPYFHNLLEYSKHHNIGLVVATRRLQHINPRVPRLSDTLIIFRVSGKDAKYVFEFLIEPEGEESKSSYFNSIKRQLTHLPDREFYTFDGKDLKQYGAIEYELS